MMKLRTSMLASILVALGAVVSAPASAHEGHHEPVTKDVATQRGVNQIEKLVNEGKLEASWKTKAALQSAELRQKGNIKEWALVYSNPNAKEASQQTFYVFLSESGRYLASNFTGR